MLCSVLIFIFLMLSFRKFSCGRLSELSWMIGVGVLFDVCVLMSEICLKLVFCL